ncbi:histidine kinase [Sanguibacter gelidistatuariae]|uniref:histidine kinase n=2 Tax=Sanguibacter gelidistatuariae TaxID=1814289 RepID=A0A1G6SXC8_9MICO|nr:histidine kinase [Sanguibacter gelidistatuariae]
MSDVGIAGRLLAAMALVLLTGGLTAWLVASALGPSIFHEHMVVAGVDQDSSTTIHAEEAFRTASGASLSIALAAAGVASIAVCLFLTTRIGRSTRILSTAATRVAGGQFDTLVTDPALGAEFSELTAAFNNMAVRLQESHSLRRRLLSDVAHELRTPVSTIMAYLEAIEDGVKTLDSSTLSTLRAQGTRLVRLADDLAAVTRAESSDLDLDRVQTDVTELITQVASAFAHQCADREIELRVETASGVPIVAVDPDRIHQVLANLVENALQHTQPGGAVTITSTAVAGNAQVEVSDTGEGIEPAHLPHLFERFYRAGTARDRDRGGSGIGLAIVKAIIEAHGGTVQAFSDGPGRGARFVITLPPHETEADETVARSRGPRHGPHLHR